MVQRSRPGHPKGPFFYPEKSQKKVEAFVEQKGGFEVSLWDVNELKAKFLSKGGMEKEIKGYEVSTCFGPSGCPNFFLPSTRSWIFCKTDKEKK